jgi:hypothetical protein
MGPGIRFSAALIAMLVLAGCGSGHQGTAHTQTHSSLKPLPGSSGLLPVRTRQVASPPPGPRLVYMYELQPEDQAWETVTIDTRGAGEVKSFVGEVYGTNNVDFRLSSTALSRIDHDLAQATWTAHGAALGPTRTSLLYTVESGGRYARVAEGRIPHSLAPLIATLSGLISSHP